MQVRDRYPRTLQQAFGPHTSTTIYDKDQDGESDYSPLWWFVMLVIASASIGLIFWG